MLTFFLGCAVLIAAGGLAVWLAGERIGWPRELLALYAAHVAAALLLSISNVIAAPDAKHYDEIAQWRLDYWRGILTYPPDDASTKNGYPTLLAATYRVLGRHLAYGALLNAILATLAIALLVAASRRLGMSQKNGRVIIALGLLPGLLLWSGLALREAGVWLLSAMLLYAAACVVAGHVASAVPFGIVGAAGLAVFRGTLMPVLVVALGVGVYLARRTATALATWAAGLFLAAVLFYAAQSGRLDALSNEGANASRASLSRAGSGFGAAHYDSGLSALLGLPRTLPRVLLGPYPTAWASVNVLAPIIWVLWMWVLWQAVKGWRRLGTQRSRWLFLPPAAALAVVIAITSGNWGTMVRIREQVTLFLIPLAAEAFAHRREDKDAREAARRERRRGNRRRSRGRGRPSSLTGWQSPTSVRRGSRASRPGSSS